MTMTPTRPAFSKSGSSWPPHGQHPPTNHRTVDHLFLATHWSDGACCGTRRAANSFVFVKIRKPIHLNWSALSGGPFEPGLGADFPRSISCGALRGARGCILPRRRRGDECEFELIDLIKITSQFIFNNITKTTSHLNTLLLHSFPPIPPG